MSIFTLDGYQNKTKQNKAAVLNTAKTLFTGTLTSSVMRKWQKLVFTVESNCAQVPLCQSHYNDMYTKTHTSNPCDSCRMKPRKGELFGRHCPAPDKINAYLNIISNEPINLTSNSAICLPCYKYFNVIFKQIKRANDDQATSDATPDIVPDIDEVFTMISEKNFHRPI